MAMRRVVQTNATQQGRPAVASPRTVDVAAARSLERNRRATRAPELVDAVARLDTTTDPAVSRALMQWIADAYNERQGGQLAGLFGRCYLGEPYVDHRLDMTGCQILEHFTRAQAPPAPFNAARPFARSAAYIFIEVYDDGAVIPVRADGRPVI